MRTTYRMMGIADFITLANGLFGVAAILFIILAVEDLQQPYSDGLRTKYIWASMLCIFLSALGDIIDGPIARRYSKRRILGGSLDIMSDSLSFCVAPALLLFMMFGRMGEATPIWTISLAIACGWVVATGMLRLARFAHEKGGDSHYFSGLSSPGNALFLMSIGGLIWLQPSTGVGPGLSTWDCTMCFGEGSPKPYFDWLILPAMFISGGMMISDIRMSKLKGGAALKLSIIQMALLLAAIIHGLLNASLTDSADDVSNTKLTAFMLAGSLILCMAYMFCGEFWVRADEARMKARGIKFSEE